MTREARMTGQQTLENVWNCWKRLAWLWGHWWCPETLALTKQIAQLDWAEKILLKTNQIYFCIPNIQWNTKVILEC